jgi:serine/threonine protein kinase
MALEVSSRAQSLDQIDNTEDKKRLVDFFKSQDPIPHEEALGALVKKDSASVISAIQQEKAICDPQVSLLMKVFKQTISLQKAEKDPKESKQDESLEKVVECFEVLKNHRLSNSKLKDHQSLSIALFVGYKSDEISKVAKKVFTEIPHASDKAELQKFPYDLKFSLPEKKMYLLTKYAVDEGGSKVARIAMQFGFNDNFESIAPNLAVQLETLALPLPATYLKERFERELSITQDLQGEPAIVKLYSGSIVPVGDTYQMEMLQEACDEDLSKVFVRQGQLGFSFAEKVVLAIDCITAVDAVHKKGYLHGDIKSDNFLLKNMRIKLCDFGAAVSLSKICEENSKCLFLGCYTTSAYTSPELLGSYKDFEGDYSKADDFALGITLWTLFSGGATPWEEIIQQFVRSKRQFAAGIEALPEKLAQNDKIKFKTFFKRQQETFEIQIKTFTSTYIGALISEKPDSQHGKALQVIAKLLNPEKERISLSDAQTELQKLKNL